MKRKTKAKAQRPQSRSRARQRLFWTVLGAALLGAGLWSLQFLPRPEPPSVPLTSLDPALASVITTARTAVVEAPKSAAAWGKLGEALHAAEFNAAAWLSYSNAARLDPNSYRWNYLLGLLELQDASEQAIQHLGRAVEFAAGTTDGPRLQLARALIERGRLAEAESTLQPLLAAQPPHAAAQLELARIHLARGALKEATHALQPALTNHYTTRPGLLIAAQIAQRNNQPDTAAQLSRRAASMPRPFDWPDPVLREVQGLRLDRERLADQANALLQQQRLAEAEAVVARLVESFPDDPEALLLAGRLRYVQRRCAEAETAYRRHLQVQPNSLNGLIQLGLSLLCQQRWSEASVVLERAVALKPDFAQAHSNLGLARSRAGDSAGAVRAYRDALRATPGDVNAHIALAEELANVGDLSEAREHIEKAAALKPDDPRIRVAREQLRAGEKSRVPAPQSP